MQQTISIRATKTFAFRFMKVLAFFNLQRIALRLPNGLALARIYVNGKIKRTITLGDIKRRVTAC